MLSSDLRPFHLRAFFRLAESVVLAPPYPKNTYPGAVAHAMTPVDEIEMARAKQGERDVVSFESGGGMGGAVHHVEVECPILNSKVLT